MNARHDPVLDLRTHVLEPGMAAPVEVFLEWVEHEEGKYEYDRGTIGMMVKVTQNHAVLGSRFLALLMQALDVEKYHVVAEAFAVRVGRSVRFPDVLVQLAGADGASLESEHPLAIVEVLSPSSTYLDLVVKREEYLSLPTLATYVVADPNSAKLSVWERDAQTGAFPTEPLIVEGLEGEIRLAALDVCLSVRELYRGVRLLPPAP